jgi:site-specific recombinase XerD
VGKNRVDFDIPARLSRADIEGFMQYLAAGRMTGVTRVRKLAAIRKYFTFLAENSILAGNPAPTVKGARREEKEPNILYKEQYNPTATLLEHALLTQGFMGTSKAAFPRRLRPQSPDSTWENLVSTRK